ncbi:SCO7613 C-terminal domain-containing membrane protein [Jatrophihabitans sp. YIM 134969]
MNAPLAPPSHPQNTTAGTSGAPTPRPDRGPLIQRVLLGAGALCVLVAGAIYLAVSWHRIGTGGQAGLALVVTALAAGAAHLLARRGLRASAEALALVAAGLLALDLAGAHHLDVFGAARLEWWLWLTFAAAVVLVVTTGLALVDRLSTYRTTAVAALAVLPATGLVAAQRAGFPTSSGVGSVVALVVGAGLGALAAVLARRDVPAAAATTVAAVGWWLVAAVAGIDAGWSSRPFADVLPAGLVWSVVAVALLLAAGRAVAAGRADDTRIIVSVAGPLAAAPAALVLAGAVSSLGALTTVLVTGAVAAVWALPVTSTANGRPLGLGAAVLGLALVPAEVARGGDADLAAALVLLLAAAAAGAAWHGRGTTRVLAGVATTVGAVFGTGLLAVERAESGLWLTCSWTAIAVAFLLTAAFRSSGRDTLVAGGAAVGFGALLAGIATQALDTRSPALAVALVGLGAAGLVHGAVRTSRTVVLLGSAGVALAAMDLAAVARIGFVEAYTLPVAAVALIAGVLGRVGRPTLSSWAWAAPAVLIAAVPTVALALSDPGVTRLVAAAAAAAALTALGFRFRLAAPLLLGAATEAVLAVSQLAPYAVGAPRWITLALAGVALLTLGVLFERARRGAAAAGRWYAALQ